MVYGRLFRAPQFFFFWKMEEFIYLNSIGDSFWNACFSQYKFFQTFQLSYHPILGWSEPFPLLFLLLVLLIVLPAIFKVGTFLKVSRLYNITRLGLLSLFHQICYSYTIGQPLSLIIRQPRPCNTIELSNSSLEYGFPSTIAMSASLLLFTVSQFTGISFKYSLIIWFSFLIILTILSLADMFNSIFQSISSFFISYLLHYWHKNLPFKFIHYENLFLFLFLLIITIGYKLNNYSLPQIVFSLLFSYIVLIIDELLLFRHHFSRKGFLSIECSKDLKWTIETEHVESIRLLNTEEEESFSENVKTDLITSFLAFCVFYFGVLLRRIVAPDDFFASPI